MEEYGIHLLIIGIMIVISFFRWLAFRPKGSRKELTGHAVVISRRVKQSSGGAGGGLSRWDYMVSFDLGSKRLELYVTQTDFARLTEGMEGQLVWQYENLISFIPDSP